MFDLSHDSIFPSAESVKLQRNSDKYQLLKRDLTTDTDREDYCYTKARAKFFFPIPINAQRLKIQQYLILECIRGDRVEFRRNNKYIQNFIGCLKTRQVLRDSDSEVILS